MRNPLNGDWIQGYTQAIQDIQAMLPSVSNDLKYHHKQFNARWANEFLSEFLKNRAALREAQGFLRYNHLLNKIEYFFNPHRWNGR